MVRYLGVDAGEARIGLAAADSDTQLAIPIAVIDRHGRGVDWAARAVAEQARRREADVIIVGLPYNMDGSLGAQARRATMLGDRLRAAGAWQVEYWDERLTTFLAEQTAYAARSEGERGGRLRRRHVDDVAAAIILQSYLDNHANEAGIAQPATTPEPGQCDAG